ncbi:dipeptidase [Aquipluma nitroreducens]|uniref:Dipeptidase n=1 Tax=Aquipluma nitroreducens TaxID=2010828 RepID=A0A5K7SAT8_9BACT|nr:dipeptidase [Aquipluma nitroreducens]BBE18691.1 dipeptidase [Aquipluma nitroreducens]
MIKKALTLFLTSGILMSFTTVPDSDKFEKKANRIHEKCLTVDTHCDTPMLMIKPGFSVRDENKAPHSRVDLPRMKKGGLDAMFFAVFTSQKPRTEENYQKTYALANQMLDSIHAMLKKDSDLATLALKAEDLAKIEKTGKRAIYIGMENGFPLAKDISRVEEFYKRGVRYITLCHSFHNDICDSSSDGKPAEHNGVSDFGKQVIAEMNRLGMMVDVSHASDKSFFDAIELSKAPIIASHSSVRAIAQHNRNMTDEMIKKLAAKGGVIQICLLDEYVKNPDTTTVNYKRIKQIRKIYANDLDKMTEAQKDAMFKEWDELKAWKQKDMPSVKDLCDHIDHVKNLVGVDYVGIGSDFDGGGGLMDCGDVSQFPNITKELLRRGYTETEIRKIWGGNLLRVFREVEKTAEKIKTNPHLASL